MAGTSGRRAGVLAAFDTQVGWCEALGSPFTAAALRAVVADLAAGGTAAELTDRWPGDPVADALPLRFAGALHGLVLAGAAPELAAAYPPAPLPTPERLRALVGDALARHRADKACAGCHERFDAIGLAFEGYGPVGESRTLDLGGRPVDTEQASPTAEKGTASRGSAPTSRLGGARSSSRTSAASSWPTPSGGA